MINGFSVDSDNRLFRIVPGFVGKSLCDRRQNVRTTLAVILRGRAQCVVPGVSAAVAISAWSGRVLAVGVRKLLRGLNV